MALLWFPLTLTIAVVFALTGEFWFAIRFLAVCWIPGISVGAVKWCLVRGDRWQQIGGTIFGLLLLAFVWWILPGAGLVVFKHSISGFTLALVSAVVGLLMPLEMAEVAKTAN
ncbi:MAG TPA: hypothetical protein VMF67_04620 [Rhizomicrobium sp.]|nr:hypothetical protein [Rhizomicrobium sp.]